MLRQGRAISLSILAATCFGVVSCATLRVGSDYYPETDFSSYRSFAWVAESPLIESQSRRVDISPINVRRIRDAIERELGAKGFEMVSNRADADFGVSFTVGARDRIEVTDYPAYYRGVWRWTPPYYWPNVDVYMYTEGTLAVDIFDNTTREPVWHGWARKEVVGADVRDPEPAIDEAVARILADFPPGAAE